VPRALLPRGRSGPAPHGARVFVTGPAPATCTPCEDVELRDRNLNFDRTGRYTIDVPQRSPRAGSSGLVFPPDRTVSGAAARWPVAGRRPRRPGGPAGPEAGRPEGPGGPAGPEAGRPEGPGGWA